MMDWLVSTEKRITKRVTIVFAHEPWWVEFWSALAALAWAYISLLSGDKVYLHAIFSELSIVAQPRFWQNCAIIIGFIQITVLIHNDYRFRWCVCFFASWFWAFLTIALIQSDPHPPSLALYASYSCINLTSMFKLSRAYV